jgi:hypothetical protein
MADLNPNEARQRWWFEPASAILMALAALSTAWCSYQSSRWNGQSGGFAAEAGRLNQKAALLHLEGNQVIDAGESASALIATDSDLYRYSCKPKVQYPGSRSSGRLAVVY